VDLWVTASPSGRRTHLLLDPVLTGQADDPLRRLGEVAGCVAHQIKNSIHSLLGFVHQIERQSPEGRVGDVSAKQYISALRTLGELAEDVLGMAGAARPAKEVVSLCDVLSSAVALRRRPDVRVRISLPQRPIYLHASRARLVHALFNLIDNASRASRPGESVDVHAELEDDHVRIDIVDSGPGMPTSDVSRAVASDGSGYGLVAVRRFVESAGGCLNISPVLPIGTRCRVVLPGASAPADSEALEPAGTSS